MIDDAPLSRQWLRNVDREKARDKMRKNATLTRFESCSDGAFDAWDESVDVAGDEEVIGDEIGSISE